MRFVIIAIIYFGMHFPASAEESSNPLNLAVDFNIYPYLEDIKDDSALTINIRSNLPGGFSYFSWTNFGDVISTDEKKFLMTEQNFRWRPFKELPFDLSGQVNIQSGSNNDRWQVGVHWIFHETEFLKSFFKRIYAIYTIDFFVKRFDSTDEDVWQMEHFFLIRFPYISDRLYLSGFLDHNFNTEPSPNLPKNPIVTEAQLGYRLFGNLHATAEYRINEFRRSDVNNFALGLEYKKRW